MLGLFAASFGPPARRRRFMAWARGYLWVLPLWPAANMALQAEQGYVVSGVLISALLGLVYSLGLTRPAPLCGYLAWSFAVFYGTALVVSPEGVLPVSLGVELGLVMVLIYLATAGRLHHAAALARREASARQAQRVAGLGVWEWDARSGRVRWNGPLFRLLGHDPRTFAPSLEALRARFHPDDVARVEAFERAVYAGEAPRPITARIRPADRPADAPPCWISADFEVGRSEDGRLVWAMGTAFDVTDRMRQEEALRQAAAEAEAARREAEELSRLKSAFLANLSHEIRTPLTSILGFVQLLEEETEGQHRAHLAPITRNGVRLLRTLQSLLDLAQHEAGLVSLPCAPVRLDLCARQAAEASADAARQKGLRLEVSGEAGAVGLGDPRAVRQVLAHLLDNAVKFTERGGVSVRCGRAGGEAWVRVEDTGHGIEAAALQRAFEPFRQGSEGHGRRHEGVGLGLTLSLQLAEAMGGRLKIEPRAGGGTASTLVLPAAPPALARSTADAEHAAGESAGAEWEPDP